MTEWLSVHVENEDEIMRMLSIREELAKREMIDILDDLADQGLHALEGNVPRYTDYTFRHTDRSSVQWRPGGAGGGGEYEVTVGIKAGTSRHPLYPNVGTGIYSYKRVPYTAITTGRMTRAGGLMWFYSQRYGHVISVRRVKGQQPQHFLYTTFRELQVFTGARLLLGTGQI